MCARRFLFLIFFLTLIVVAGAFAIFQFGGSALTSMATPQGHFEPPAAAQRPRLCRRAELARAARASADDPSRVAARRRGRRRRVDERTARRPFYIHPTTYLERDRWNAPLDAGGDAGDRADLFVRSQASAFNGVVRHLGAALSPGGVRRLPAQQRGCDQGARPRLSRRAARRSTRSSPRSPAGRPDHPRRAQPGRAASVAAAARESPATRSQGRLVAAYVVGWPLSVTADLPAMGLPACRAARRGRLHPVVAELRRARQYRAGHRQLGRDRSRPTAIERKRARHAVHQPDHRHARRRRAAVGQSRHARARRADLASATLAVGQVGARCERRLPADRRRDPAARPLRPARQQLSRLRLCLVLGIDPRRCRAAAGGVSRDDPPRRRRFRRGSRSGRLGGLDVGTKTIGLATCDATWSFATPAETIRRTKFTADLAALRALHRAPCARRAGRRPAAQPRRQRSARAPSRSAPSPATSLPLDLPMLLWDERWSTVAVERTMIEADMSRAKRAEKIDAHAAAHILQAAIDALVAFAALTARPSAHGPAFDRQPQRRRHRRHPRRGRALVRLQSPAAAQRPPARRADHRQRLLRKFDAHPAELRNRRQPPRRAGRDDAGRA